MTIEFALEYLRRRTEELGYRDNAGSYRLRFRHFVLSPSAVIRVDGGTALFLLITPPAVIRVESETGLFDLTETNVNELQYEHQGTIVVTNYSATLQHLQMIQVIL